MVVLSTGYGGCRMRKLTYALKDGKKVHVDEVESGQQCGCTCPVCGADLVARNQGDKCTHHFAHLPYRNNRTVSKESELHKLAKQIISTQKSLMLPGYYEYIKPQLFSFDDVEVEERNDYKLLQPDCVGIKYVEQVPHRLWIEIKVTHGIERAKLQQIKQMSQSCIEIDLRQFKNRTYSKEELERFLLYSQEGRTWIYTPYEKKLAEKLQKQEEHIRQVGQAWLQQHPECMALSQHTCEMCQVHTFREELHELLLQTPYVCNNALIMSELMSLSISALEKPLATRKSNRHSVVNIGKYSIILKDVIHHKNEHSLYFFLRETLPKFSHGQLVHCTHRRMALWSDTIACDSPIAWQMLANSPHNKQKH